MLASVIRSSWLIKRANVRDHSALSVRESMFPVDGLLAVVLSKVLFHCQIALEMDV